MIPHTISTRDVRKALRRIDQQGVPPRNKSTKYDLVHFRRRYPPKYAVSIAGLIHSGKAWPIEKFNGGDETNNFLLARGFVVIDKKSKRKVVVAPVSEDEESSFPEGCAKYRIHRKLERDSEFARKVKARRIQETGKLCCDACGFNFKATYGPRGEGFIEAHHNIPVSLLKRPKSAKPSDLSLVCSNCHRILHRTRPWLTIPELRRLLR